jgi:hypothetical protein
MPPLHPAHFLIVGADHGGQNLADLSFLFSNATVPTWWTQHPAEYPVLTGWFAGPKADKVARLTETELIDMGLVSLTEIFNVSPNGITRHLVASRAINWGNDPFAHGADYPGRRTIEASSSISGIRALRASHCSQARLQRALFHARRRSTCER